MTKLIDNILIGMIVVLCGALGVMSIIGIVRVFMFTMLLRELLKGI
jgi:hypothetical protein